MRKRNHLALVGLALALIITVFAQDEGPYQPYRQKLPDGTVSWYEGWIQARAEVPLMKGLPRNQAQVEAQRTALLKAQAAALRIAMKVPMDADRRLEEFEALKVRVQGVIRGGKVIQEGLAGDTYSLTLEVPISGVNGIVSESYPVMVAAEETRPPSAPESTTAPPPQATAEAGQPQPEQKPVPPQASKPAPEGQPAKPKVSSLSSFASVRIDATEAGAKPALFPKVKDEKGQPVYSVATVKPDVAKHQTIARYVSPQGGSQQTGASPSLAPSSLPLAVVDPMRFLLAQGTPPPKRPHGEENVLTIHAVRAEGGLQADLVITPEDAQKLRDAEAANGVLSSGNVVVVVRADVGGVESRLLAAPGSGEVVLSRR
jgi:hypothetical protein